MLLKSAVYIICAVHFLTSAWGTGLNRDQLNTVIRMYENDEISGKETAQIMENMFGIKSFRNVFKYDSKVSGSVNLKELLLALAYEDKPISDCFECQMLTAFEVELFLNVFAGHVKNDEQEGYLTPQLLKDVFEDLKIDGAELLVEDLKAKNSAVDSSAINPGDFLLIMLDIKPEGNGLNQALIKKLVDLYKFHKTNNGSIDTLEVHKIFKEFDMATTEHESKIFKSNRPAEKELMELVIVTAERNRTVKKNEDGVLCTEQIRRYVHGFTELDLNKDGLLSAEETSGFLDELEEFLEYLGAPEKDSATRENSKNYLTNIYFDGDKNINIAEFLEIIWFYSEKTAVLLKLLDSDVNNNHE
ncbi:uncharacterized protein LOC126833842 isoform X2 [Adelges cooleyi]|uniref:uncharacterized protein LOC126833842 isoform X2 n=1 Tax=Adelges cooleyi TaxID=133065 RepID=UPI00217F400D|nr:uncharacterized protein LOC126833842 isoform X2 [Adelges cooleyi]